jgi:hypothetical protein
MFLCYGPASSWVRALFFPNYHIIILVQLKFSNNVVLYIAIVIQDHPVAITELEDSREFYIERFSREKKNQGSLTHSCKYFSALQKCLLL